MAFPADVNSLGSVSGSQTLAAAGHATRHNEVKTALEGLRDVLGGTAVPSGTVQPILAAGSASAPSLSFTGDSNTGLWSPAADTVAASTGGTERMRIDSSGRVGIGTSSPGNLLHLSSTNSVQQFDNYGISTSRVLARGARGTAGSPTASQADDTLLNVDARGYGATGFASGARVQIAMKASENHTDSAQGTYLVVLTTPNGSTTLTERMKIDNAGVITGTGTSLGAWTAYTPTLGGTGWAIGNGTITARYCQLGKIVIATVNVTMGSTTTYGAAALTISLPVTAATASSRNTISSGDAFDVSASSLYQVRPRLASTTTMNVATFASPLAYVIDSVPFTWASTDQLNVMITYEIA